MNVRPYHYPPVVKDEIERQVADMLKSSIICPSNNPFFVVSAAREKEG
jgi:hypothetical protein